MASAADPPLPTEHLSSNPGSPIEEKTILLDQPYTVPRQVLPIFESPSECLDNVVEPAPNGIYAITADQYNQIQNTYFTTPLPNDILFPWLHGVSGRSYQQCLFFGIRQCLVPVHRGLTIVHADEAFPNESRLVGAVLPNEILASNGDSSDFLDTTETELGINLRNFRIQVARYATISDIVVYGSGAIDVARRIRTAQRRIKAQRQDQLKSIKQQNGNRPLQAVNDLDYRTFVIIEPFDVFEQKHIDLVCLDRQGNAINRINFWEQEREEMYVLTKASQISKGVWLGNTQDVPLCSEDDTANPHRFSICIETHDLADMPLPSTLTLARVTLNDLPPDQLPEELIHLDCYSSGSSLTSTSAFDVFYSQLYHVLEFMDEQVSRGRNILIHCADGYTETSMLALSWIMYKDKRRLPGAYLDIQESRSFFVYSSDVEILKRVEQKLLSSANGHPSRDHKRKREETAGAEDVEQLSIGGLPVDERVCNKKSTEQDIDLVKNANDQDEDDDDPDDVNDSEDDNIHHDSLASDRRQLYDDTFMSQVPKNMVSPSAMDTDDHDDVDEVIPVFDSHRTAQGGGQSILDSESDEIKAEYPWFYSDRFEGSFPSRILPFLYLGNLNHATNPKVLKALGITHVLSVGENANLGDDFKLLLLDNLYDDGIDSLWGHIDDCINYIDEARLQGGKCLIHCRVGVSRSATITICYVMKHMRMSLVQAYLFVRARRLNVIIQPNLKFMYELLQYEQRLLGRPQVFWQILAKEIHSLNMCYRES
ncbi:tyrosine/serine/threonine protein phosphatase pps1 [Umbelopsis sp. WA50703]